MLPIRDINPRVRVPVVNYGLLALTGAAFLFQASLGQQVAGLVEQLAFVPADLHAAWAKKDGDALLLCLQAALASMVLHAGWFHIIGNLLYLRAFGDNVEDRFGHPLYLGFYVLAGLAGTFGQYVADPQSSVPLIGASGAIAGVLGAYIVLFPAARVVTLFPIFIFLTFIEVPAFVFLGIWALQQLLNGYLTIADGLQAEGGVAWFAHLGGFAFGVGVGAAVRITRTVRRRRRKS